MMSAIARFVESPYPVAAGWTLLVILWETTAIAVTLGAWRTWRARASARQQHTAAVAAFTAALILAAATPFALRSLPISSARPAIASESPLASPLSTNSAVQRLRTQSSEGEQHPAARLSADRAAGTAALVWIFGIGVLTIRLIGGWVVATSIRRRALPVTNETSLELAQRLDADPHRSTGITLLQSSEIEAPVVIGWRRPALILPSDVTERLSADMMSALLAHELEHVKRRDYLANGVQSVVELLLFFSPAVAWMSRCIREAREYCCDDAAVETCGDARHYVQALTTLASLGTINPVRPAMGISGPRLITRVRRLLQGQSVPRYSAGRLLASAAVLVTLIISGVQVTTASAARAARIASAGELKVPRGLLQDRIPYSFASEQEGSGVDFQVLRSTRESPLDRASIRNMTNQPVAGVQFVAAVERWVSGQRRMPVRLFVSDVTPISIRPGETVEISPAVITEGQVQQVAAESPDARLQLFFGLSTVLYANGFEWSIAPNPAAVRGGDVVGSSRPQLPRTLLARDANRPRVPYEPCRDDRGRAYSHGAMVPLVAEPGRLARCENGRWVEGAYGQ